MKKRLAAALAAAMMICVSAAAMAATPINAHENGVDCPGHSFESDCGQITVNSGTHHITLNGVNINGSGRPAMSIASGAVVHLTLVGENHLTGGRTKNEQDVLRPTAYAALEVPPGAELIITKESTGSLEAMGGTLNNGRGGAGIGGSSNGHGSADCGIITIEGGTITATGGGTSNGGTSKGGAGIGGGYNGAGGTITITGGTIELAQGGRYAAGIGGGGNGDGGTITITGGKIVKAKGDSGSGIGRGDAGSSATIKIGGNAVVTAEGDSPENGIDCGAYGTIDIDGNAVVTAKGDRAGIYGDAITIGGNADVTAEGGIDGGSGGDGIVCGAGGSIEIRDYANVKATGGEDHGYFGGGNGAGIACGAGGTLTVDDGLTKQAKDAQDDPWATIADAQAYLTKRYRFAWIRKLAANTAGLPQTGDNSHITLWLALLTLAGTATLILKRKTA